MTAKIGVPICAVQDCSFRLHDLDRLASELLVDHADGECLPIATLLVDVAFAFMVVEGFDAREVLRDYVVSNFLGDSEERTGGRHGRRSSVLFRGHDLRFEVKKSTENCDWWGGNTGSCDGEEMAGEMISERGYTEV